MKRCVSVLLLIAMLLLPLSGCGPAQQKEGGLGNGWEPTGSLELRFATQFSVEYYQDGYKLLTVVDGDRFLLIPEGGRPPEGIDGDIVPLYRPINNVYMAATAIMCLFDQLDALDTITLSGTKESGWYIENAVRAMQEGKIVFAGKYDQPDYELMLGSGCRLAVESTMIGHASEVKDKLESLGIPVLVDHSSLESHPLGRVEWIKFYGALLDKEEEAEAFFSTQEALLDEVLKDADTGKTAAFFYINSTGRAVARRTGDYVTEMIELAGGHYVFKELGDPESRTATVQLDMETFFAAAKDADYLIYNSTIGGEVSSMEELLEKSDLLKEFKAVQNGNVWCTGRNMYQEITTIGQVIRSFHAVFTGEADGLDELPYLTRLR